MGLNKRKSLVFLFFLIVFSSVFSPLFAEDAFYDAAGFNPNRETFSMVPYEHIDTFTGGITLSFIDARLPGNGGLALVIQRTFNSKNVCKTWGVNGACGTLGENSWIGLGWTLHFGRIIDAYGTNPAIEMPDGSQHKTFRYKNDTSKLITRDYWIFDPQAKTVTFTDGRKIYFGHQGPYIGSLVTLYATKITDAFGNQIDIVYKNPYAQDEIIDYITDTTGRKIYFYTDTVNYDQKLTSISGPGVDFNYTHEGIPNWGYSILKNAKPPVGNSWTYSYDSSSRELTGLTSPGGGAVSYAYIIKQFVINGQLFYFRVLDERQASGRSIPSGTWNFSYLSGTSSDTTTISDPCSRTITYKHYGYGYNNAYGSVWKIGLVMSKSISGEETTNYTWDKSASISYEIDSSPYNTDDGIWVSLMTSKSITRGGQTYTTNYSNYDSYGNPGTISESGDKDRITSISYWYNTSKNIVQNKPSSETVSGGFPGSFTTGYSYNSDGSISQLNRYGVTTDYGYYSNGNLQSETNARGKTTSYDWSYGVIKKITAPEYTINRAISTNGTIASETNGRGYTTYFTYDGNLRLTSINPPAGNTTTFTYPSDNSYKKESRDSFYTYYYYDGFGRPKGTSNSKGVDTNIVYKSCGPKNYSDSEIGDKVYYDNFGRIRQVVHKDGNDINYSYSGSSVTMSNESDTPTTYTYKAFGNPDEKFLTAVNDPDGNTVSYGRNIPGNLTSITQGSISRSYTYNSKNFLVEENNPETGTITYTRDNVGNMKSRSDLSGIRNYSYDEVNRLTKISTTGSCNGCSIPDIDIAYDGAGNRTSMTGPSALISYTYDPVNRLTRKNETISGTTYSTDYSYDGNDNLTDIYYPTDLHVTYTYNSNNEVSSVIGFGGSVTSFTYNLAGLPTSFNYSNGKNTGINYNSRYFTTRITSSNTIDLGYTTYDLRGNVKAVTDYLDSSKSQSFNYDSLDRLTGFSGAWGSGSYGYSASGNRLSKTVAGINTSYSYSGNRLTSATGGEPAAYDYYGNGNLQQIQEGGTTYSLTYDGFGNMIRYSTGGNPLAEFEYDGDGMRIKKTASGKTIIYHHDQAGKVISETAEDGIAVANFVYVNGKLAAKALPDVPYAPSGLSVTNAGLDKLDLSWSDNSTDETGFRIERKAEAENTYTQITTVGRDVTAYSDTGLAVNTTYYYRITAYNSIGFSPYSNETNATTVRDTDNDGIPDEWEMSFGLNPELNDATFDPDSDGYSNLQEYINGTHPAARIEVVDSTINKDMGKYNSIALDSNNKAHISYYNSTNANLNYATNVSGNWVRAVIEATDDAGKYSSIAVDSNDKVHISYYKAAPNYNLRYATNISGVWALKNVEGTDDVGKHSAIALDNNNKAHISYYKATNTRLKYATNVSGSWVTTAVDTSGSTGTYTSIAADSDNKLHISYYDAGNKYLKYATNASGSWVTTAVDTFGNSGTYTSIALDFNNKAHISYYDAANTALKYATNVSGGWVTETIDTSGNTGTYSSIAVDFGNNVHISYHDAANGSLKYATNVSGSWLTVDLDPSGGVGTYTSIAIDPNNKIHVSYYDAVNGDLKYVTSLTGN
jgi:YD repeat-containing protein